MLTWSWPDFCHDMLLFKTLTTALAVLCFVPTQGLSVVGDLCL